VPQVGNNWFRAWCKGTPYETQARSHGGGLGVVPSPIFCSPLILMCLENFFQTYDKNKNLKMYFASPNFKTWLRALLILNLQIVARVLFNVFARRKEWCKASVDVYFSVSVVASNHYLVLIKECARHNEVWKAGLYYSQHFHEKVSNTNKRSFIVRKKFRLEFFWKVPTITVMQCTKILYLSRGWALKSCSWISLNDEWRCVSIATIRRFFAFSPPKCGTHTARKTTHHCYMLYTETEYLANNLKTLS